jgi:hypothetical protein
MSSLRLLLTFGLLAAVFLPSLAAAPARHAVELTFLQAARGQRENLKRFIELNWFAMDRVATERGLMTSYRLLDSGTDEGPWHLIVIVTYPDERGYDGIRTEFEKIRQAHTVVPVDGKGLRDLGRVVETKRLFADSAGS